MKRMNGQMGNAVFRKAKLGEDAALVGAVSHWIEAFHTQEYIKE
jgi:hypothetical protein